MPLSISVPISKTIPSLTCGEMVFLSGTIYTARDQAHKRLVSTLQQGEQPPIPLKGQLIYYCGPTPPREDNLFGSAGPTTSARMDPFAPFLYQTGLWATLGKGPRNEEVRKACEMYNGVYFITFGGAGAYLARCIISQELFAYPDLGTEAIYKLTIKDFPAIVAIDNHGNVLPEGEWALKFFSKNKE